jgi:hypothetical protein
VSNRITIGASAGELTALRGSGWGSFVLMVITLHTERDENLLTMVLDGFMRLLDASSKTNRLGCAPDTANVATRAICKTENPNYYEHYNYLIVLGFNSSWMQTLLNV